MYLCGGCEAADYPHKVLKHFDGSMLHARHTLEGGPLKMGSGGKSPPLGKRLGI